MSRRYIVTDEGGATRGSFDTIADAVSFATGYAAASPMLEECVSMVTDDLERPEGDGAFAWLETIDAQIAWVIDTRKVVTP